MARIRQIILWLVLVALVALAVLSVVGAFLGADRAKRLFNAVPLVVYWFLLAALLLAGFLFFRRLIRSPAALGMHLGSLLVLGGAMWGSAKAHDLRRAWLGSEKVPGGYMVVYEGRRENRLLDGETMRPVAELPFGLHLRDFWIEYYPATQARWPLVALTPQQDEDGHVADERQDEVAWSPGEWTVIPNTRARLKVLQYLEHAAPVYADGAKAVVEITGTDGKTVTLPPQVGAEARLEAPPLTVRVARVFENVSGRPTDDGRELFDAPGEGTNPAVEVELVGPDAAPRRRLLMALLEMHGRRSDDPEMRYRVPEPIAARPDPDSDLPAMELVLECAGREFHHWFVPAKGDPYASLQLAPLAAANPDEPADADKAGLFLVAPRGPIRDYFSELGVIEKGKQVAAKVIEVNHPLHWGGYHFYQADYDHQAEQYTVLSVSSDSGLLAVWIGLVLLVASTFWRFWVDALWRHTTKRRHGEAG